MCFSISLWRTVRPSEVSVFEALDALPSSLPVPCQKPWVSPNPQKPGFFQPGLANKHGDLVGSKQPKWWFNNNNGDWMGYHGDI